MYNFLTRNRTRGPYGREMPLTNATVGDVVQLSFDGERYAHSLLVVATGAVPSVHNIQIAAHTYDTDYRLLDTYTVVKRRLIHIEGVRE